MDTRPRIRQTPNGPLSATIQGTNGPDSLTGAQQNDVIEGRAGNDTLNGGQGDDTLFGGEGDDLLRGGGNEAHGDDFLDGGAGADSLFGGEGFDTLYGGEGADLFNGGGESDTVLLQQHPRVPASGATIDLNIAGPQDSGDGMDSFVSIENVVGTEFRDLLIGNSLDNRLVGRGGRDTLIGGDGDDHLGGNYGDYAGGDGRDFIRVTLDDHGGRNNPNPLEVNGGGGIDVLSVNNVGSGQGVRIDLSITGPQRIRLGVLTVDGVEVVSSGKGYDLVKGDDANNTFHGGGGNDTVRGQGGDDILFGDLELNVSGNPVEQHGVDSLWGGAGDDTIMGGRQKDQLDGGGGVDVFRYLLATDSRGDRIGDDFSVDLIVRLRAEDVVDLSALDANGYIDDGNQAFRIVTEFTGADGELKITYDAASDRTWFVTDLRAEPNEPEVFMFTADGNRTDFTGFVL